MDEKKDLPASVHRRLLNISREEERPFNELLQYYAMERFLYRMSKSAYSKKFILKGAMILVAWSTAPSRLTSDLDLLGQLPNNSDDILSIMKEVCEVEVEPDGVMFDTENITIEPIAEIADYPGVRVKIMGNLGSAMLNVQVDIGFDDVVVPKPDSLTYPVLLDMPAPRLRGYSRESLIAEKLESIVRFGILNSRIKDFYDIWQLSRVYGFDGNILQKAVDSTFSNRHKDISSRTTEIFHTYPGGENKEKQWEAFLEKNRLETLGENLKEVCDSIRSFVEPVILAIYDEREFNGFWPPGGPWKNS